MDDGSPLSWIFTIVLLFLAAYFAIAETSFAAASRPRIKALADDGSQKAIRALKILDNLDLAITTLLIGTNIVHISVASIVTVLVTKRWGMGAVSVSTILTTLVVFFSGEMLPKSIAKKYPEKLALSCASSLGFLMKVFRPLSIPLARIGQAAAKLSEKEEETSVTEDELHDIIDDMTEEGRLPEDQGDLISSALQFGDVTAESILTPRVDVAAIDIKDSLEEILRKVKEENHSRFPVYEGSIDNIIGILQIRRFLKAYLKYGEKTNVRTLLQQPLFMHQSAKIDEVLSALSKRRMNLAVVTDNYGGTLGIVTVENILEELVGEIWDEDDVMELKVVKMKDGSFLIDAEESVGDAFDEMDFEDPEDHENLHNKLAGEWAYEQFPMIPHPGDAFTYHNLKVTVISMDHNRIRKLRILHFPPEDGAEDQKDERPNPSRASKRIRRPKGDMDVDGNADGAPDRNFDRGLDNSLDSGKKTGPSNHPDRDKEKTGGDRALMEENK